MTLNINGQILSLDRPIIMGILNITSDSFFDGGHYINKDKALARVDQMIAEGAAIIDIGAFSSRPGADLVPAAKEIAAIAPVLERIVQKYPNQPISIDTYQAKTVRSLAQITSFMVNDISGFSLDSELLTAVAEHQLPYVLMHMRGTPKEMQDLTQYDDVTFKVLDYLAQKLHILRKKGIYEVIIDPGFGFAKTLEQNYKLLSQLNVFNLFERPVMVGLSRKSMIYKALGTNAQAALNGTTALHMTSLMNGAKILRVHDVKEAMETITLWSQLQFPVND